MLVHSVYFWLKKGTSPADRAAFRAGLESLDAIKAVGQMFVGRPASTEEAGVIDNSFDFALTVLFTDQAALDAYSTDPLHEALVAKFAPMWQRVVVHDAQ